MVDIRFHSLVNLICCCLLFTACTQAVIAPSDRGAPVEEGEVLPLPDSDKPSAPIGETAPAYEQELPAGGLDRGPVQHKASQAVIALLGDADQYVAAGEHQQAQASLERALRIDPKNPLLWHKLGRLHLQQGEWQRAITLARKSNVLAQGDPRLQSDNWLLIAHAKKALGDNEGASEALNQSRKLGRQ